MVAAESAQPSDADRDRGAAQRPGVVPYGRERPLPPRGSCHADRSGVRDIPEESRRVEVWGGYLCGDAHTVIAINSTPLSQRSFEDSITFRRQLFRDDVSARSIAIPGASRAERMAGLPH